MSHEYYETKDRQLVCSHFKLFLVTKSPVNLEPTRPFISSVCRGLTDLLCLMYPIANPWSNDLYALVLLAQDCDLVECLLVYGPRHFCKFKMSDIHQNQQRLSIVLVDSILTRTLSAPRRIDESLPDKAGLTKRLRLRCD